MTPRSIAIYLALCFLTYIVTDIVAHFINGMKRRNLILQHKIELDIEKKKAYNAGFKARESQRPLVQHCNSRTNHEFIKHPWDPQGCKHCSEVQDILNER